MMNPRCASFSMCDEQKAIFYSGVRYDFVRFLVDVELNVSSHQQNMTNVFIFTRLNNSKVLGTVHTPIL